MSSSPRHLARSAALASAVALGVCGAVISSPVEADEQAIVAIDEFGDTVVYTIDDPRLVDAAAGFLDLLRADEHDEGSGGTAAGGAWEPPCRPAEGADDGVDSSTGIGSSSVEDGLKLGSPSEEAEARRGRYEDLQREREDAYVDFVRANRGYREIYDEAAWFYEDHPDVTFTSEDRALANAYHRGLRRAGLAKALALQEWNELKGVSTMAGLGAVAIEAWGVDQYVEVWYEVFGSAEPGDGAGALWDHLNEAADQLDLDAGALEGEASDLDEQADQADADGDSETAQKKREEAEKKRQQAAEKRKLAAEAREKAKQEKEKATPQTPDEDLIDPDNQVVTISDLGAVYEHLPWLQGTEWDPNRRMILIVTLDPSKGVDPTVSNPDPTADPHGGAPTLTDPVYEGLILILDPTGSSGGDPCVEMQVVFEERPDVFSDTVVYPNPYDPDGGPIPDDLGDPPGPPLGT